jgi:hypothetical protein
MLHPEVGGTELALYDHRLRVTLGRVMRRIFAGFLGPASALAMDC